MLQAQSGGGGELDGCDDRLVLEGDSVIWVLSRKLRRAAGATFMANGSIHGQGGLDRQRRRRRDFSEICYINNTLRSKYCIQRPKPSYTKMQVSLITS